MSAPFRLVVVGAGVAGLEIATRLGTRHHGTGRVAVTLIDRGLAHVWKPGLHTVAAGTVRTDRARVGLFAHAARHGYRFRPGTLDGVDRAARVVRLGRYDGEDDALADAGRTVPYDALVIAVGSRANDFGTPGVADHCHFLDDLPGAEAIHALLRSGLIAAFERDTALPLAIIGGGATGVELAAEMRQALDVGRRMDPTIKSDTLRLTLLESGDRLLPAFPATIAADAERTLRSLGVVVRTGARVTAADADGLTLDGGERVPSRLTVWAAGVRAPASLDGIEGLERGPHGTLAVDARFRTTRDPAIYALGDCAALHDEAGVAVPPTAQGARQAALWFVAHADALFTGKTPPSFRYRDRGTLLALGDYNGWGTLGRYQFGGGFLKGVTARAAHELLYRQHLFAILGAGRGTAVWAADTIDGIARPAVEL